MEHRIFVTYHRRSDDTLMAFLTFESEILAVVVEAVHAAFILAVIVRQVDAALFTTVR